MATIYRSVNESKRKVVVGPKSIMPKAYVDLTGLEPRSTASEQQRSDLINGQIQTGSCIC